MPHSTRDVLVMAGNAAIADFWPFIWVGGTLYKWSKKEPKVALATGFKKDGGHDDLVRHVTEEQGRGSNFISCSLSRDATGDYGDFLYEIVLTHPHTKAMDANAVVKALTKHTNPFAHQQEVAIYKQILPTEIEAVWLRRENPQMKHDPKIYNGLLFEEARERVTRKDFLARA